MNGESHIVMLEWGGYRRAPTAMTIRFHCDRCDEWVEYTYSSQGPPWPEWRELAEKSAYQHHDATCPPRRGLYQKALVPPLTIKQK